MKKYSSSSIGVKSEKEGGTSLHRPWMRKGTEKEG